MSTERSPLPHETARVTEATETVSATQSSLKPAGRLLSADTWAVLVALAAALLVKLHILNTVKW